MRQLKTKPFPYFVGVYSLEELATKQSRVCVINILGSESRKVTPVSHEYSGGNIVAGVQYGRSGKLETSIGNIPVYPSVRDVMKNGHSFDTGVIYLPPTAVSQAVSELVSFNHDLKKIVIVTEKVSTADSRNIRFLCQEAGVDVIGCNCLGVANAWDQIRLGGALGGDNPEEALKKGSVAIHSNSGNFTTTITEYLRTSGFGISTAVSSGKDVYIHFGLPEFLYAAQNDPRTKAIALYCEPGGYYEKQAIDMINNRVFGFNKPIVVCVTGRWKKDISRSVGHAGALAGSGDDAISKENWFDEYFDVPVFDPKKPVVSKRGVRVDSIQVFPEAMKAIYAKIDEQPDFESSGDLSLKLWLSDNLVKVPDHLYLPLSSPISPYDEQLGVINKQIGAQPLRQNMADKSGASKMNRQTQVAELHGQRILDLSTRTLEENIYFSLAKVMPDQNDVSTINLLLNLFMKMEKGEMDIVDFARKNNASPNAYLSSAVAAIGSSTMLDQVREYTRFVIDIIREFGIDEQTESIPAELDEFVLKNLLSKESGVIDDRVEFLLAEVKKSRKKCTALRVCQHIIELTEAKNLHIPHPYEFLIASIAVCIFWQPMHTKRITRQTVEDAVNYLYVIAKLFASAVIDKDNNSHWKRLTGEKLSGLNASFSENAFKILFNRKATDVELVEFKYLIGLTLTNGPGTISAKGSKESVSARSHISMAFVGFMANTGFAHGGNGFEAVEYLLENFKDIDLTNPGSKDHDIDIHSLALKAVKEYSQFKQDEKALGKMRVKAIPCVNHPVFKGNAVNIDPREDFVRQQFEERGISNVFLEFYHHLVQELFNQGVTKNVFCVNIDAVLAVISLKLVWSDMQKGKLSKKQIQDLVFTIFLFGRTIGVAAEIADHRDRGTDMDCRTPQSKVSYVL
jgi:succinyl-CoA synthetase alpha subunit/citrate synthase